MYIHMYVCVYLCICYFYFYRNFTEICLQMSFSHKMYSSSIQRVRKMREYSKIVFYVLNRLLP